MRIGALLLAAIMGAVLFGCATTDSTRVAIGRPVAPLASTLKCFHGNCFVPVSVTNCVVDVPYAVVNLGGPGGGAKRVIVWLISDAGYGFSTDPALPALAVKGSGAFFGTPIVHGPLMTTTVTVASQNTSHEYGLNIVKTDGTKCPQYDPWFIE
jgi:hypothetical protein